MGATALFYSTIQPGRLRLLIALAFMVIVCFAALTPRRRLGMAVWCIAMTTLAMWHLQDRPSNDRAWTPEYATPATAVREGQSVKVEHIRNFTYSSEVDYTSSYYDATFPLDGLATVDLVASYWPGEAIAHVFVTFGFDDGRHLAVSVETRRQVDVGYSAIAELFHHYELFYVVADERDLIGVHTDSRRERVHLYRLDTTAQQRQALFLSYMDKVQQLVEQPEWYNSLSDNGLNSILVSSDSIVDVPYNRRVLLSGYAGEHAGFLGLLGDAKAVADLRKRSLIKRPDELNIGRRYSQEIRREIVLGNVETGR